MSKEEKDFALMLRHALTEYDFKEIEFADGKASVELNREIMAEDQKASSLHFSFDSPALVNVLRHLREYLPAL